MKKIAIVSRGLTINGATKALVEMLKRVRTDQCAIDVWVLDFQNNAEHWIKEIPDCIKIRKITGYGLSACSIQSILRHPYHFYESICAGKILRKSISVIESCKFTAKRLPIINKEYDIAISFRHFDVDIFYAMDNIKAVKKYFWVHGVQQLKTDEVNILRTYYQRYDGIFPVSVSAKANFVKYFPDLEKKCRIAYCVVDAYEVNNKSFIGEKIKDDGKISLFTISRLGEEKGIDIAVLAAKILKDNNISFKWFVAGDGSQREMLQKMIKRFGIANDFFLLGNVKNPYGMLKTCDIYIQPSRLESYGLAINEAKILHKPIICSDIPAGREQIVHGKTGLLFDLSEINLAQNIQKLILDTELRNTLVHNLSLKDWSHFEAVQCFNEICY